MFSDRGGTQWIQAVTKDVAGHAADDEPGQTRSAVRPHHDKVRLPRPCRREKLGCSITFPPIGLGRASRSPKLRCHLARSATSWRRVIRADASDAIARTTRC
jgi:hypothetical protein